MLGNRVSIASDHAGFHLKTQCVTWLKDLGYTVIDNGPSAPERCDYPDYAQTVCTQIENQKADWGVLICGTGIGMSMAANKFPNIRAALISDSFCAAATRQHNDANVLCMGERVIGTSLAQNIVKTFVATSFEGGRHLDRIQKFKLS
jgi:ribose 5-phosphate isomerase B